jgi:hypothetical protein
MKKQGRSRGPASGLPWPEGDEPDQAVTLPVDVQAAIARGEAAFKNRTRSIRGPEVNHSIPSIITSVIGQEIQDLRDANLNARPTKGDRRQPPMTNRLRAVMILVDRLISDGMPFGVGPNSRMNRAVRDWLNVKAKRSPDTRVSRRKEIGATAVRALLRQVKAEGRPAAQLKRARKQTTQEIAADLLKKLRSTRSQQ